MLTLGEQLRKLRQENGLPLRKVAAQLDIDQSILSKIERGQRMASREQVLQIAKIFKLNEKNIIIDYLSDRVFFGLKDEEFASEALKVAEEKIKYKTKDR